MNLPDTAKRKGKFIFLVLLLSCVTVASGIFLHFTLSGATVNPLSLGASVQPTEATSPVALQFPEYDFSAPPATAVSVVRSETVRFVLPGFQGSKVEFYDNGFLQAVMRPPKPSRFEWTVSSLDNGRHSWTAKSFGQDGVVTTYQPILFDVLVPAEQSLPVVPVLSIRYIPSQNGLLHFSTLPLPILDGIENKPVAEVQDQINEDEGLLYDALERGAIYHGFKDPYGVPGIQYRIIERKTVSSDPLVTTHPPASSTMTQGCVGQTCYDIDYVAMLNNVQVCNYIEKLGVKQIWLWMPGSQIGSDETSANGPYWYSHAANGTRTIPLCGKTYGLFTFNYGRGVAEALESYMHHFEAVFKKVDKFSLFWDKFVGGWQSGHWPADTGTMSNPRRCGWAHTPPQGNDNYDYFSEVPAVTNCGDWHPDGSGELKEMTCHSYSNSASCYSTDPFLDANTGWKVYWLQNLPGKANGIFYMGRELRNWLDFIVDFDKAMQQGANLFLPQATPITNSVTVTKTGTGLGTINSNPSGLYCGSTCQRVFAWGTSLALTATPATGSTFAGWQGSGACTGSSRTIQFAIAADTTCTARFDITPPPPLTSHSLTITKTGTGQGTVSSNSTINCGATCQSTLTSGTVLSLTATPAGGSTFVGWQGGGVCTGSSRTIQFAVLANTTCSARFDLIPTPTPPPYTISPALADLFVTTEGDGTYQVPRIYSCQPGTCSGRYEKNTSVRISASPRPGSRVDHWGGACSATTGAVCYVTMDTSKSVTIYFTPVTTTPNPVSTSVAGTCGTSNNQCLSGTLSDTADTFDTTTYTYRWSCLGLNGGTNVTCSLAQPITTPTYACTNLPANANPYSAPDNTGLTSNTTYTYSGSDTTAIKCQFNCLSGYAWDENSKSCVANTPPPTSGQLLQIISPVAGTYQIGQSVEVRYIADPSLASKPLKLELISFYTGGVLSTIVSSSCSGATYNCIWGNQTSYRWQVGADYPYPGWYRLRLTCVNSVGSSVACKDANGVVIPPAVSEPLHIQNATSLAPTSAGTAAAANAPSPSLFDRLVDWLGEWF